MLFRLKLDIDPIIAEMFPHIPQDRLIHGKVIDLSMGGGQFIREVERLKREAGLTSRQIRDTVTGIATDEMDLSYVKRRNNLVGTYMVGNPLTMDWSDMKYDVIVGNPPYQMPGEKSSNKLWDKFVTNAIKLCKDGGHVAFITPTSWMSGNKIFQTMNAKKLLWINSDASKYFPTVGSTFSAWVLKNEPGDNRAIIDGKMVDWSSLGLIPKDPTPIRMSILSKLFKGHDPIDVTMINSHVPHAAKQAGTMSDEQTAKFRYPIYHTNAQTLWSAVPHLMIGKKKVIVTRVGYWNPVYDVDNGTTNEIFIFPVTSKQQGNNLIGILNSKLFRFALQATKYSGFFSQQMVGRLPQVDSTRSWTDADLYEHFGLTKDEIDHVESRITDDTKV